MGNKGLAQFAVTRRDIFNIDPAIIHVVPGFNARDFSDPGVADHVADLAASIAENGVQVPLRVRWHEERVELIDGECRLRAALQARDVGAEIKTVPVMADARYSNEGDRLLSQITANSGRAFSSLEKAHVFKRLVAFGWTEAEIAKKVGMTRAGVVRLLELGTAPRAVAELISTGKISATLAIDTMREAKGDQTLALDALNRGVERAEAQGVEKATRKHMPAKQGIDLRTQRDRLLMLLEHALKGREADESLIWIARQLDDLKREAGLSVDRLDPPVMDTAFV